MSERIAEALTNHWALNPAAAHTAAERMGRVEREQIYRIVEALPEEAVTFRDESRALFAEINTIPAGAPPPPKKAVGQGPCSGDCETAKQALFDHTHQVQADNPNAFVYVRLNGAKPRTNGKYLGAHYALDQNERDDFLKITRSAFEQRIPILTEVTAPWQLGIMAPFLTGFWIGARDSTGSDLRATSSGLTLPVGVKNTLDGDTAKLEQAIEAIRQDNDPQGSGMRLPDIGEDEKQRGISVGTLPAYGNPNLTIIARGHDSPAALTDAERRTKALEHISSLCIVGAREGIAVTIDGSHDTPKMFGIERTSEERFPQVMRKIFEAIANGEIEQADAIRGMLCEMGTATGRTDKNWIVSPKSTKVMSELVRDFISI